MTRTAQLSRSLMFAWLLALLATPAPAQWLNYPTPGIPRTADGKPALTAPAPRTVATSPS